ncbi:hypothetical protein GCM10027360_86130 [Amycolatopsis echigonensis]
MRLPVASGAESVQVWHDVRSPHVVDLLVRSAEATLRRLVAGVRGEPFPKSRSHYIGGPHLTLQEQRVANARPVCNPPEVARRAPRQRIKASRAPTGRPHTPTYQAIRSPDRVTSATSESYMNTHCE